MSFIPVILSGGSGTRLWPVSRTAFPKQFCEIFDRSLLEKTIERVKPLGSPAVLTTAVLSVLTERALKNSNVAPSKIPSTYYEPYGKNTAPAIAFLCRALEMKGLSETTVGIFPADHLITNEDLFVKAVVLAKEAALKGNVVTVGIQPTFPATGYGYIEVTSNVVVQAGEIKAVQAKGFREKPDTATAEKFIQSGNYFWNAGMFVFQVKTMQAALEKFFPEGYQAFKTLKEDHSNLKDIYASVANISIDFAVMEKIQNHVCVPCALDWNDVGSWDEIAKALGTTPAVQVEGSGNFAYAPKGKTVTTVGVSDLVIVDTTDALLISKKGSTQKVKDVVDQLKAKKSLLPEQHPFEHRPWGDFEILRDTADFKSKVIHVLPGQQLSYQSHAKRAEHWVIVKGNPEVVLNDEVLKLNPGENVYIPLGAKHRIRNPSATVPVEFVEVQVGTYFGEDDIVRYQDDYKRV